MPLRGRKAFVAEEGLHVKQRDAVLHQPRRSGVPHDARREHPDASGSQGRVPDPAAEVGAVDRPAIRRRTYE